MAASDLFPSRPPRQLEGWVTAAHDARVRALGARGVFASLSDRALAHLVARADEVSYASGEELMVQGTPGDFACLILSGSVAIDVTNELGRSTVATLGPGDLVGELAAFSETTRIATVTAIGPVRALRIERRVIRALLAANPDMALSVIGAIGDRFNRVNGAIAAMTQAARALAADELEPGMLDALLAKAGEIGTFAEAFRNMALAISEKQRIAEEMGAAAAIQRAFLPRSLPETPYPDRFEVATLMKPAREVGGDFYDLFTTGDGRLAFAVGDVSGKGIPAALFMSFCRVVLRTVAREGGEAGEVLARANAILAGDNAESMFVTLALGILDLETGVLDFASGGHEETFLLPASGGVEASAAPAPPSASSKGRQFGSRRVAVAPGDTVVFATDGVTEAFDPARAMYGRARLVARLARAPASARPSSWPISRRTSRASSAARRSRTTSRSWRSHSGARSAGDGQPVPSLQPLVAQRAGGLPQQPDSEPANRRRLQVAQPRRQRMLERIERTAVVDHDRGQDVQPGLELDRQRRVGDAVEPIAHDVGDHLLQAKPHVGDEPRRDGARRLRVQPLVEARDLR